MAKILLIGNSGDKSKSTNGQVIKVRLYRDLILQEGADLFFVDLENFVSHPLKKILAIKKGIKKCSRIVLITAQGGSKILIPLVNAFNRKSKKPFVFPMIGINILHKYVDCLDGKDNHRFMNDCDFGSIRPTKRDVKNLKKISTILPENDIVCNVVKKFFGLTNVEVLNNFRCKQEIKEAVDMYKNEGQLKLIFLSRVTKEKGIFDLLKATNDLIKDGQNIFLDVYGEKCFSASESEIFEAQLNDNVKYCGVIDNFGAIDVISNHDVFVFPTLYKGEGTPGVISEALIAGTPIISTNFAQAGNLLIDRKDSLIYEMGNIDDLKKKILYFTDRNILQSFSENASISGQRYTFEYNRNKFLKFIIGLQETEHD